MLAENVVREIRELVVAQCDPYQFPKPWDFLPVHDDVRCLPAEPAALLTRLREQHPDDVLIKAGVAQIDDGTICLRSKLNTPGEPVFILRHRETRVIVDMLTDAGSVFEEELPVFSALAGEQLLLVPDSEHHEVVVVFSVIDLVILRSCGIPATLAVGMECLSRSQVDRLCTEFGLGREKSERLRELEFILEQEEETSSAPSTPIQRLVCGMTDGETGTAYQQRDESSDEETNGTVAIDDPLKKRLVFVIWSLSTLDSTPSVVFNDVAISLKELKQHVGVDLYEVRTWAATAEDIERLRFFTRRQDAESVREALLDKLYSDTRSFEQMGKEEARQLAVPNDLPAAMLMLRESLVAEDSGGDGGQRRREALQHLERLLHEQVIDPLMNEAMDSPGATERAIGLAAAQVMQTFLTKSIIANARITSTLSREGMAGASVLPLEEIRELMAMGDRVSKLYRELERCRHSTVNVIQVPAGPQSRYLALPNSV